MRNYALMMLIGDVDAFEGYVYTWRPWEKALEYMLIHNEYMKDTESVELALFALPEGYTMEEDARGALIIYDPSGCQANVVTSKQNTIFATDYPNNRKYFNKIITIWKRENGKKVYNDKIATIHGRLSDAVINQIYGAIAYDLGDDAASKMMEIDKRIKAYYLENVKLIAADDVAAGIIQDAVLVHLYGDTFGNGDCILADCTTDDFSSDDDVTAALQNGFPINCWWEDAAGVMHEEIDHTLTDEELEIAPTDDEEEEMEMTMTAYYYENNGYNGILLTLGDRWISFSDRIDGIDINRDNIPQIVEIFIKNGIRPNDFESLWGTHCAEQIYSDETQEPTLPIDYLHEQDYFKPIYRS